MTRHLPDELIAKIIDYSESTAGVAMCRLVCKRWNYLAEPLMFGKHIIIRSEAAALSLYGHLCRNPRYGKLVKRIHFQDSDIMCILQQGLLRFIFTPNIEQMRGQMPFGYSFFQTIIEIANSSPAKFDKLQVLPHPLYYSNIYDDALIAFKDTLREMVLVLDVDHTQANTGIINYMMDFKCLVNLTLTGNLGSMFLMEEILQHCLSLEELTLHLHLADNVHDKNFVETWALASVKIVNSVKKIP
ncbi:unnamed protein product [Mucor fragilis]